MMLKRSCPLWHIRVKPFTAPIYNFIFPRWHCASISIQRLGGRKDHKSRGKFLCQDPVNQCAKKCGFCCGSSPLSGPQDLHVSSEKVWCGKSCKWDISWYFSWYKFQQFGCDGLPYQYSAYQHHSFDIHPVLWSQWWVSHYIFIRMKHDDDLIAND